MSKAKNILWIMADQLRYDYLSCYGATHIDTPNLDRLAARGMRFNQAYVQSPICGPSRMSFYTGRYVRSHGATWNGFPLPIGTPTLGDHLREAGVTCWLVGKTHMTPDSAGMKRLGISMDSEIGRRVSQCGFDVFVRDDGTNHDDYPGKSSDDYEAFLRQHGYEGGNLWEEWANTGVAPDGSFHTGWLLKNAPFPARIPAEHSETAWLTTRGIDYIEAQGDTPWLCHLSYIKPHWPYLAPAPYNDMYGANDVPQVNRAAGEKSNDSHPLMQAWLNTRMCRSFARDEVRDVVAPVYMGLVKQLDDEMGRLFDYLETSGRMEDTMIVFCSDHGDNMGDHWMAEKDLFHDCSARIPLIIYDPSAAADATRGTVSDALVEGIDLTPTFMEMCGAKAQPHVVEGRSLVPLLHGKSTPWRECAISEYDFATRDAREALGIDQADARLVMVYDGRWKYVHCEGFRPMLFDLKSDPGELTDLGADPAFATERKRLSEAHFGWARRHHARITKSPDNVNEMLADREPPGIMIAYWNRAELEADGYVLPSHVVA